MSDKKLQITHKGVFFNAVGEDAIVLHNITGYQLNQKKNQISCGFTEKAIEKVAAKIEEQHVSYVALWENGPAQGDIYRGKTFEDNRYDEFAMLKQGDAPVVVSSSSKQNKATTAISKEDLLKELDPEDTYGYLEWLCRTAAQRGIRTTLELQDPTVSLSIHALKTFIDRLIERAAGVRPEKEKIIATKTSAEDVPFTL